MKKRIKWIYRKIRRIVRNKKNPVQNEFSLSELKIQESVLCVIHSGQNGGAPLLALYIIKELKRRGCSVITVCLETGPLVNEFTKQGLVYIPSYKSEFEKVLHDISSLNINKCICNSTLTGYYVKMLKKYNYKVISLVHELPNTIDKSCAKKELAAMLEYSDTIVFPSSVVKNRCLQYIGVEDDRRMLIKPQGLYLREAKVIDKAKQKVLLAQSYNFNVEKPLVINVASTIMRKGFDIFIELASIDPEKTYLWVGVQKNQLYDNCLKKVGGRFPANFIEIEFLNDVKLLEEIYSAADVLALTSREEPFGSVVLEAFSCGTPVAAFSNCGGFVDIVLNNETGELAENINSESMLYAINRIISNSNNYKRISNNCISIAQSMSFENYVDFLMNL